VKLLRTITTASALSPSPQPQTLHFAHCDAHNELAAAARLLQRNFIVR
jgi:hypothetical protein